jgi:protein arginine kinase activator
VAAEQDAMANYCEGCGEDPVTHEVFKDPLTGEFNEHHFCANCPKAQGLIGHPENADKLPHQVAVVRVSAAGLGPCVSCGMTFARFRETGRLGCPSCYDHFESAVGPMIARAQEGATHHVGKLPKRALSCASGEASGEVGKRSLKDVLGLAEERARKVASLRDQLRSALSSERYEQAALIRDQIEQLQSLFGTNQGDESMPIGDQP